MADDKKEIKPEVEKPGYYNILDKSIIGNRKITTLGHQTGAGVVMLVITETGKEVVHQSLLWINHARIEPYTFHGKIERYDLIGGQ